MRGEDQTLQHRVYDGTWQAWESLGGSLASDPAVASWQVGRLDVFARGAADNALWHIWFDGNWHAWESLGGSILADPAVTSWGPNRLDVFTLGSDATLQHIWFDGSTGASWRPARDRPRGRFPGQRPHRCRGTQSEQCPAAFLVRWQLAAVVAAALIMKMPERKRSIFSPGTSSGMAILNGLWSGQPFRLQGTHYHVEEMTFLPTPVQHMLATWDIRSEKLEACAKKIEKGQPSAQCTCRRKASNQAAGRRLLSLPMGGKRDKEDTHAYLTKIHETLTAIRGVKKLFKFVNFYGHFIVKYSHEIEPVCKESWNQL